MKSIKRYGVKRKLVPRYVGPFQTIGKSWVVAYKIQLPPKMRVIFNVFHVSQLKKCLRVPEERVPLGDIKLESDLTYEKRLVHVIDTHERVTPSWVVKFYKVMWSNQGSESDATWEREDYLREGYKEFYQQWYAFQISGWDFYKGEGCNTPGVWLPYLHLHFISMSIIHLIYAFVWTETRVCNILKCTCFIIDCLWNVVGVACRCNMSFSYIETWQYC
jgi:hypothetical protein